MNSEQSPRSVVSASGFMVTECGYCNGGSRHYGISAQTMTCQDYQDLIDRGWRRSGKYIYKPDLRDSCCKQYTIRLDASKFKSTKSQRKIINKFNRYIQGAYIPPSSTDGAEEENDDENEHKSTPAQPKTTAQKNQQGGPADWIEMIHAVEEGNNNNSIEDQSSWKHRFRIVIEPSSFTEEEYNLFHNYQINIHGESSWEQSREGYRRFLVNSPLLPEPSLNNPYGYGSFHQKYYIDDKLVAVAVLDFLPKCVSSVYFMYDSDYSFLGLGKYSALREIALSNELGGWKTDETALKWYYMGFYIHTCQKMKYKGQYRPSDLLDPETYEWYPIEKCLPLLDKEKYIVFSQYYKDSSNDNIEKNAVESKDIIKKPPPGMLDPSTISINDLKKVTIKKKSLIPLHTDTTTRQYYGAVGSQLAKRMILYYN